MKVDALRNSLNSLEAIINIGLADFVGDCVLAATRDLPDATPDEIADIIIEQLVAYAHDPLRGRVKRYVEICKMDYGDYSVTGRKGSQS